MEPSSTRTTSSATGGSTWTVQSLQPSPRPRTARLPELERPRLRLLLVSKILGIFNILNSKIFLAASDPVEAYAAPVEEEEAASDVSGGYLAPEEEYEYEEETGQSNIVNIINILIF